MKNSNNISKAFLSKDQIIKLIKFAILIGIVAVVVIGIYYIDNLENQVAERDALIRELTVSDNLVKDYFDIKNDSTNTTTYILKDSKKTQIVRTITENTTAYPTFKQGDKTITLDELLEYCNKIDNQATWLNRQNEDLIKKHKELLERYSRLLKKQSETESDNANIKSALNLMKNNYGLSYEIRGDSLRRIIRIINSSKIDSALLLLPHYRDRLQYDSKDKSWIIFLPKKEESAIIKRTKH